MSVSPFKNMVNTVLYVPVEVDEQFTGDDELGNTAKETRELAIQAILKYGTGRASKGVTAPHDYQWAEDDKKIFLTGYAVDPMILPDEIRQSCPLCRIEIGGLKGYFQFTPNMPDTFGVQKATGTVIQGYYMSASYWTNTDPI